eukprot:c20578_g1_i1 orf=322-591(+)
MRHRMRRRSRPQKLQGRHSPTHKHTHSRGRERAFAERRVRIQPTGLRRSPGTLAPWHAEVPLAKAYGDRDSTGTHSGTHFNSTHTVSLS